ncbi:MAG: DUF1919 domain-containing protein [Lachnospiraceae bacterium]|nr:DUF1919 domain-containing protein [Lachnospiraceae bacterium]
MTKTKSKKAPGRARRVLKKILRLPKHLWDRARLKNKDFSLISMNCTGGMIYHELRLQFCSPTINLFFSAEDFVKLCSDLKGYLEKEVVEVESPYPYPVGMLGDLTVHFMHYPTFAEAKRKWDERCARVNYDNVYLLMCDRDGCTEELARRFDAIGGVRGKVFYSYRRIDGVKSLAFVPDGEEDGQLRIITGYRDGITGRKWFDAWDYVPCFNRKDDDGK